MSTLSVNSIKDVQSFDFANTSFASAFGVANASYNTANVSYTFGNTVYAAVNSAFAVINAAYTSSNADYAVSNAAFTVANAGFGKANTALQNTTGTLSGSLYITGSVGIGTNSPGAKVQVANGNIVIGGYNYGTNYGLLLSPYDSGAWKWIATTASSTLQIGEGATIGTDPLVTINATNVGIGATSPTTKLDVYNAATAGHLTLSADDNNPADGTRIDLDYYIRNTGHRIARISSRYTTSSGSGEGELRFFTKRSTTSLLERMGIDGFGRVTKAYQPCFFAYDTLGGNRVYNSGSQLIAGSTHLNVGNHYNTSTYYFTAPVAGIYLIYINIFVNQSVGGTNSRWYLGVNDAAPTGDSVGSGTGPYIGCLAAGTLDGSMISGSQFVKLGVNDTVGVFCQYNSCGVYGGHTGWGGYLLG